MLEIEVYWVIQYRIKDFWITLPSPNTRDYLRFLSKENAEAHIVQAKAFGHNFTQYPVRIVKVTTSYDVVE